jgi:hypothetical protein
MTYKHKGWLEWGDWLGTATVSTSLREFRPFAEGRLYAHSLELKGRTEWIKFCNGQLPEKGTRPKDIPSNPNQVYRDEGWKGMGDWLGTGTLASHLREYRPYGEARAFVHSLGLKSFTDWRMFCKGQLPEKGALPKDIPAGPNRTYKHEGWIKWGDWLGTGAVSTQLRKFHPFEEARAFVHGLGLKSRAEWRKFCKGQLPGKGTLPRDIPADPRQVYKDKGWKGMGDWLGMATIAPRLRKYRPFGEARIFAQGLGLKNAKEWFMFSKGQLPEKGARPEDIPACPNQTYRDKGWINWGNWLGGE